MKVNVSDKDLKGFRRRACKAAPKEYGELLYGDCSGDDIVIAEFVRVPYVASASHFWYDHDKITLERESGKFIGTIHSHVDSFDASTFPIPSQPDWFITIQHKEVVQGICHIKVPGKRPRATIHFYLGHPAVLETQVRK